MPIKDREKRNEYSRKWTKARRDNFFYDKECSKCGSKENLVLHHKNPSEKTSHRIWGWSEEKRTKEISKCIIVCDKCHRQIHLEKGDYEDFLKANRKLTNEQVLEIKKRLKLGERQIDIAKDYPVTRWTISKINIGANWN